MRGETVPVSLCGDYACHLSFGVSVIMLCIFSKRCNSRGSPLAG
jgi:hypothetical protein